MALLLRASATAGLCASVAAQQPPQQQQQRQRQRHALPSCVCGSAFPGSLVAHRQRTTIFPSRPQLNSVPSGTARAGALSLGKGVRALAADDTGSSSSSSAASDDPQGTAMFAKEMERVAAKEALLLAIKDAGGASALSPGRGNEGAVIEVEEKLLALERLNPTPRPTSSPLLEGTWDFVWIGARSPGVIAAKVLLSRFPAQLASLDSLSLLITSDATKATAQLKFLNNVETSVTLSTTLAAEGPLKLKEEYVEGVVATPTIPEGSVPEALKPVLNQLSSALSSLPEALKDGLKVPLSGRYSREILVSYLDDEILVARDRVGLADVLVRAPVTPSLVVVEDISVEAYEYQS